MQLELFHLMDCPFSVRVRDFIEANGLKDKITYHDVDIDDQAAERLVEEAGEFQVPCLMIDGEPLLESDAIIDWLDTNLVRRKKDAA